MTATTPELDALLRAIVTVPDDDHARLVYADALDELPTTRVPCSVCKGRAYVSHVVCGVCLGTGEVVDTSPAERAEFIRVQVELSKLPGHDVPSKGATERYNELVARETFLLGRMVDRGLLTGRETYRRGFVEAWSGTGEEWLGVEGKLFWHPSQVEKKVEKCRDCDGDGYFTAFDGVSRKGCPVCVGGFLPTEERPRPCPPSAHPLRKVTLMTRYDSFRWQFVQESLERRWPGIEITVEITVEVVPGTGVASDDIEDGWGVLDP